MVILQFVKSVFGFFVTVEMCVVAGAKAPVHTWIVRRGGQSGAGSADQNGALCK